MILSGASDTSVFAESSFAAISQVWSGLLCPSLVLEAQENPRDGPSSFADRLA